MSVNELMTGVTGAATDEFVEIVNTGTAAADLSGWKLVYRSAAGTGDVVLATVPDGTSLAAGGFYLFGGAGYVSGPPADQTYSTSIAATGGGVGNPRRRRQSRRLGRLGNGDERSRRRNGRGRTRHDRSARHQHRPPSRR